jgi:hypothetical protein
MAVRYIIGWYVGGVDNPRFKPNIMYPLAVKKNWWTKKVKVYERAGYDEDMKEGTYHEFENQELFNASWQIIREEK